MAHQRFESKPADYTKLGQPLHFEFSNRTSPNKFLKGAMSERLATWHPTDLPARGIPTPELINLYRRWGEGGAGVILTGNVQIAYDQLETAGNTIITPANGFSGPRFEKYKELATEAKKHGSLIIAQVSHPGRQVDARLQPDPVSASDVKLNANMGMEFAKPHAASQKEIEDVIESFAHAAEYLDKAGFDGIQLHGAHGYLISQFLSQTTNHRTDAYGGSITNRARIVTDIAARIQSRVSPSFVLSIKLNSVEFQAHGLQPEEAREIVQLLEASRFDFVELSGGTYEQLGFIHKKESSKKRESFFMEFADLITPALKKTKCFVTGGFRTVGAMVDALSTIDGIGLARPMCSEPRLVNSILKGEVDAAIKGLFDENDFTVVLDVSCVQIRQIGKDEEPFDVCDERAVEAFKEHLKEYREKKMKDEGMEMSTHFDFTRVPVVKYGTVQAAVAA